MAAAGWFTSLLSGWRPSSPIADEPQRWAAQRDAGRGRAELAGGDGRFSQEQFPSRLCNGVHTADYTQPDGHRIHHIHHLHGHLLRTPGLFTDVENQLMSLP